MRASTYWRLKKNHMEALSNASLTIIKNKDNGKIYISHNGSLASFVSRNGVQEKERIPNISWNIYIGSLIISSIFSLTLILFLLSKNIYFTSWTDVAMTCVYSFIQLALHELSHFAALSHFGKKPDSIGFKMNYWIFPAFYVRMNDVYLLQRREQIIVHTIGALVNIIINAITFAIAFSLNIYPLLVATCWFGVSIVWNVLPILDSDGYKALLSWQGNYQRKNMHKNAKTLKLINIINYFIVLTYISIYLIVIIKGVFHVGA